MIQRRRAEWAIRADEIMVDYGAVFGPTVYQNRHEARWQARSLISAMVELDLHPRSDLVEHTERRGGGWIWAVKLLP
jgi:hypothetical protein